MMYAFDFRFRFTSTLLLLVLTLFAHEVASHGYMYQPISRNYYAHTNGVYWGSVQGVPPTEYCPHCLNQNSGVCGITQDGSTNYDEWLDSTGQNMPFLSQHSYTAGETIEVLTYLTAHHGGHLELRGCPDGRASTQECFDRYKFEFVSDDSYNMPKDPDYPERGYYWGGTLAGSGYFAMSFKIPEDLVGEQVLLQWHYITANSCSPPGYSSYFGGNNSNGVALPDSYWSPGIPVCTMPLQNDGSSSPERFWNCAEVTIEGSSSGGGSTTLLPTHPPSRLDKVTSSPTVSPSHLRTSPPAPVPTAEPTMQEPVQGDDDTDADDDEDGSDSCGVEWADCYNDHDSCCDDNYCQVFEWYAHCRRRPDACLVEWSHCGVDDNSCCEGLVCKGSGWLMCQK